MILVIFQFAQMLKITSFPIKIWIIFETWMALWLGIQSAKIEICNPSTCDIQLKMLAFGVNFRVYKSKILGTYSLYISFIFPLSIFNDDIRVSHITAIMTSLTCSKPETTGRKFGWPKNQTARGTFWFSVAALFYSDGLM